MATPSENLRAVLGERIPALGTEADTMFTDAELLDLLAIYGEDAEIEGWRRKAAEFASLVDTTEGTSKRAMSDLHSQALAQIKALQAGNAGKAGTRLYKLRREGELG